MKSITLFIFLVFFLNATFAHFWVHKRCEQWCLQRNGKRSRWVCCESIKSTTEATTINSFCPNDCAYESFDVEYRKCQFDSNCLDGYKCCADNCEPYMKYCKKTTSNQTPTTLAPQTFPPRPPTIPTPVSEEFQYECPADCADADDTNFGYTKCSANADCTEPDELCCVDDCVPYVKFCKPKIPE